MVSSRQKSSAVLYSLSSFEDLELELKLEPELESELKSELPLLSVLGTIRAGVYQMSVDHKKDT